jgi:NAD(P)-dependent dehydrogenase (short-subunit alcohol dehydrogenase family)
VQLVNAVAPFVLNARLRELMRRTPGREKHIVNVSAMEGSSTATSRPPAPAHQHGQGRAQHDDAHLGGGLRADGIHMNSVDTGWVTDEDPVHIAARKRPRSASIRRWTSSTAPRASSIRSSTASTPARTCGASSSRTTSPPTGSGR